MSQQAITALDKLGFSTYEARVYLALLRESPVTGYRLSKLSGVPRSRVYETLERLVAKGYAVTLQAEPAEYAPLPVRELLTRLKGQFDDTLSTLKAEIESLATAGRPESIWNLRGRAPILSRARAMIARAQKSAYLVAWAQTIREVQAELETAAGRGVRTVAISCGEIELAVGSHYRHAFEEDVVRVDDSSINLVVDGAEVLVGETLPAGECQAAWSRNAGLVFITEEYIRHEVYLHKIIEQLGEEGAAGLREAFAEGLEEVPYPDSEEGGNYSASLLSLRGTERSGVTKQSPSA
ncbi:MAG: TrmB family transcriptional regulator [Anaerolineae bacterium]